MDPKLFFNAVRRDPFGGTVNQEQVNGINAIVSRWDDSDCRDPR